MKIKTLKTSETGKKIESIYEKLYKCKSAIVELSEELNFKEWRQSNYVKGGGATSVRFNDDVEVNTKYWKKCCKDFYFPKKNTKHGKYLASLFEELPTVSIQEVNNIVNLGGAPFQGIGINTSKHHYFILADEDWNIKIPNDCEEITVTEYKKLTSK